MPREPFSLVPGSWRDLPVKGDQSKPRAGELLAGLIAFDEDGRALWPSADLEVSLRQHLRCPLSTLATRVDPLGLNVATAGAELTGTLGDLLLRDRTPSLDLLRALKDFAKREVTSSRASVPPDIALLLYYGSIIVARLRRGERISRLSDDDLRRGLNWAARQLWLDAHTRDLFFDGMAYLRAPRARWRNQ